MTGFAFETLTRLSLLLMATSPSVLGHAEHQHHQPGFLTPGQYKEFNYPKIRDPRNNFWEIDQSCSDSGSLYIPVFIEQPRQPMMLHHPRFAQKAFCPKFYSPRFFHGRPTCVLNPYTDGSLSSVFIRKARFEGSPDDYEYKMFKEQSSEGLMFERHWKADMHTSWAKDAPVLIPRYLKPINNTCPENEHKKNVYELVEKYTPEQRSQNSSLPVEKVCRLRDNGDTVHYAIKALYIFYPYGNKGRDMNEPPVKMDLPRKLGNHPFFGYPPPSPASPAPSPSATSSSTMTLSPSHSSPYSSTSMSSTVGSSITIYSSPSLSLSVYSSPSLSLSVSLSGDSPSPSISPSLSLSPHSPPYVSPTPPSPSSLSSSHMSPSPSPSQNSPSYVSPTPSSSTPHVSATPSSSPLPLPPPIYSPN